PPRPMSIVAQLLIGTSGTPLATALRYSETCMEQGLFFFFTGRGKEVTGQELKGATQGYEKCPSSVQCNTTCTSAQIQAHGHPIQQVEKKRHGMVTYRLNNNSS